MRTVNRLAGALSLAVVLGATSAIAAGAAPPGASGGLPVVAKSKGHASHAGVVTTTLPSVKGSRGTLTEGAAVAVVGRKVLVAGTDGDTVVLVRYRHNGRIDRSFAHRGIARVDIGGRASEVAGITTDRSDRILVAATADAHRIGRSRLKVLRLEKGGRVDHSFARHGIFTRKKSNAGDVLSTPSGRIVVTGRSLKPSGALVLGLQANGRLDHAFGRHAGVTRFSVYGSQEGEVVGTSAGAALLDAAGRVLVHLSVFRGIGQPNENGVARLRTDGRLDHSFHGSGFDTSVTYGPDGRYATASGLTVAGNGDLVSGGDVSGRFLLLGYDADGSPQGTLSRTNMSKGYDEGSTAVATDRAGRVVSVGHAGRKLGVTRHTTGYRRDGSFSGDGRLKVSVRGYTDLLGADVAVDRKNRIIVVGSASPRNYRAKPALLVVRLTRGGQLDKHWGH